MSTSHLKKPKKTALSMKTGRTQKDRDTLLISEKVEETHRLGTGPEKRESVCRKKESPEKTSRKHIQKKQGENIPPPGGGNRKPIFLWSSPGKGGVAFWQKKKKTRERKKRVNRRDLYGTLEQ